MPNSRKAVLAGESGSSRFANCCSPLATDCQKLVTSRSPMVRTWPGDNGSGTVAGRAAREIVRSRLGGGLRGGWLRRPRRGGTRGRRGEPASRRKPCGVAQPRRWASSEAGRGRCGSRQAGFATEHRLARGQGPVAAARRAGHRPEAAGRPDPDQSLRVSPGATHDIHRQNHGRHENQVQPVGRQVEPGLVLLRPRRTAGCVPAGRVGSGVERRVPVACGICPTAFDAGEHVAVVGLGASDLGRSCGAAVVVQGVQPSSGPRAQQIGGHHPRCARGRRAARRCGPDLSVAASRGSPRRRPPVPHGRRRAARDGRWRPASTRPAPGTLRPPPRRTGSTPPRGAPAGSRAGAPRPGRSGRGPRERCRGPDRAGWRLRAAARPARPAPAGRHHPWRGPPQPTDRAPGDRRREAGRHLPEPSPDLP